jgi:hypothetical protein
MVELLMKEKNISIVTDIICKKLSLKKITIEDLQDKNKFTIGFSISNSMRYDMEKIFYNIMMKLLKVQNVQKNP